jgi:hypothetical protein
MGSFMLPVAAEWGHRVLPAGDYTFVVPSAASPDCVYVRGEHRAVTCFAVSVGKVSGAPMNQICLIYDGSGYRVRSLKLRDAGKILYFDIRRPEPAPLEALRWFGFLSVLLRLFAHGPREAVLALRA